MWICEGALGAPHKRNVTCSGKLDYIFWKVKSHNHLVLNTLSTFTSREVAKKTTDSANIVTKVVVFWSWKVITATQNKIMEMPSNPPRKWDFAEYTLIYLKFYFN